MPFLEKAGGLGRVLLKRAVMPSAKPSVGYTRRIERIMTDKRICAMTFDDGPMELPASPDRFEGRALTDVLLDTLAEFGAKGTFDVVGDTGENYPDRAGRAGSAAWNGIRYDHFPDLHRDAQGGAANCGRLIRRILDEGHQIACHGYRHISFGKAPLLSGRRERLGDVDLAVEELERLHRLLVDEYDYAMTMARPAHYVDAIGGGFTSYDVCDLLGYQYLAASFDGGGWLPSPRRDPEEALKAEVAAMVDPVRRALEADPDFFRGQIIFQKDGYNMARRTPVAWGLRAQLELLRTYGYQVVTAEELMAESPFSDVGREDPLFDRLCALEKERAIVFSDNTLRLEDPMTWGELALLLAPREEAIARRWSETAAAGSAAAPSYGAMLWCELEGVLPAGLKPERRVDKLPGDWFGPVSDHTRRSVYAAWNGKFPHYEPKPEEDEEG